MAIEIRRFYPDADATNISTETRIEFDIVALDSYTIDITTLSIELETASNIITDETNTLTYTYSDDEVSVGSDIYNNRYYHVILRSGAPFDENQSVTVNVNVSGEDELGDPFDMDEYSSSFTTSDSGLISDFRFAFINATEKIPVYNEILHRDSTTSPRIFNGAFERWNDDKFLKIRVNDIITKQYASNYPFSLDLYGGRVLFNSALSYNDKVDASYTFRFFSSDEIESFFKMAVAQWTIAPPWGGPSSIYSALSEIKGALLVGASVYAFRELLMQMALQERRIIFDSASGNDGWRETINLFKQLYEANNEIWKSLMEGKKAKLPAIEALVSLDVSLPGGRSISSFDYLINYNNSNTIEKMSMDSIYNMAYENRWEDINISTFDHNGKYCFSPILCIENEGKKELYEVSIISGNGNNLKTKILHTTNEHKYETPLGMIRLKYLNKGSEVYINNDQKKEIGKIQEINKFGIGDVYEIEVPKHHKFLFNDVSVSNSRMFRYLYK